MTTNLIASGFRQKMDFSLKQRLIFALREGFSWLKRLIRLEITATHPAANEIGGEFDGTATSDVADHSAGKNASSKVSRNARAQLLMRLRDGDQNAWDEVYREWSQKIFSYLRFNLPTSEDAEDLLSETFMAAVKSIHHFDGKSALSTWLYTLAHNKMVDFWRSHQVTEELPLNLSVSEEESGLDFQESLNRLPSDAQQALLLRYREGLGVDEVAKVMGKTYKATESLLSRARAALKVALRDSGMLAEGVA